MAFRSYRVDPNETVSVSIFVDTRNNSFSVLQDKNLVSKALGEDVSSPFFSFDHSKEDGSLPEGVFKETAYFSRVNYEISQEIEKECIDYDANGNVKYDFLKRSYMRIKYLLKDWTLKDSDPTLTLTVIDDKKKNRKVLSDKSVDTVMKEVNPLVIKGFMEAYDLSDRIDAFEDEQRAIEAVEKEGLKAKN